MRVLITNDDGIHSPGLRAIVDAIHKEAECLVVAPHKERSATAHSISLYDEIWVESVHIGDGLKGYSVEGTPADCVKFAFAELLKKKVDLIISGINLGLNTGISVYYSGTVSAAREGLINGVPSIAISQGKQQTRDFAYAGKLVSKLVHGYKNLHFPKDTFLNINVPPVESQQVKGIRVTKQAHSRFDEWFEEIKKSGSNGRKPYQVRGDIEILSPDGTSDEEAIREGYVSMTPLLLDSTHYKQMSHFEKWVRDNGI